ncbi:MAG: hypothetical protein GX800_00445 [Clostridiaceae bacterium]|nr:hypothetical protein [Clostridiaceae bacterium]
MKKLTAFLISTVFMANLVFPVFAYANDNTINIQNGIVEYKVNKGNGRFTIHTADGLPDKASDNDKNLLFFWDLPDTSFTTFKIYGEDYIFGNSYGVAGETGGIVSPPVADGNITTTVWRVKDVEVTQKLHLIVDASNPNIGNTKISYTVLNKSNSNIEVGSRILLDTQLGSNDASPMLVGANYITNETEYLGEGVPAAWKSADEKFAPGVISYGLLSGFDNIAPSKMVIAHWQSLSNTKWDYTPNELINFTTDKNDYKCADSAVALYYDPTPVNKGQEIAFETFYGIGSLSDTYNDANFNFQVNTPNKLTVNSTGTGYNEQSFKVVVSVDNNSSDAAAITDANIILGLSDELEFAQDQPDRQYIQNIAKGETYSVEFEVVPKTAQSTTVAQVGATIKYGESYAEASKFIVLPSVKGIPPKMQMTEISPTIAYTKSQKKTFVIKGSDFDSLKADYEWTMFIKGKNNGISYQIMRKDINITNDTLTVNIDNKYEFKPDNYDIILYSSAYGNMTKTVELSGNEKYDRKEYGTLLMGAFSEDEDGKPVYDVVVLEKEEEYNNLSNEIKDNVLLTIRGEIFEYEINGQIQYDCGSGTIINRSILYTAPTAEPSKCLTIKRYNAGGVAWWGAVQDSLVLSGSGFLTIGDYTFHYGDFYVSLNDGEEYELAEATDAEGDDDYNWDNPLGGDETSKVEIITPTNVVSGEILKTVGALTGTRITINNAVIGTNTVSLGGSISVELPWMSKASDKEEHPNDSDLKKKYDKNDRLSSGIGEGKKNDDMVSLNLEEMRYGVNSENSAYLEGLIADGKIQLDSGSIPKLDAGGAHAAFALNSLDYDGMYAAINAGFNVGKAFECDGTVALVFETGGNCIPDSVELVLGGQALRIPLGAGPANVGYLTKIGGGVYNLYNTIKGYYNVIPPLTLKLISGYCDPTLYSFQLDTIALEFGLNGFELTAEEGKIVGLSLIEEAYAKFLVYCTEYDGVMYPCVDIGAGIKMNLLGIIKGEGSIWLVADPRIDSVFGHVSLGGKAYVGVFIPDYIPVLGGLELAAVMAELSTYRAYLGVRVLGIPFSVGYYWADKKVKFNDDFALLAQELNIPKEEYENALSLEYVGTESNSDGLMVFGGNLRETYSSKKNGVKLMSLEREHNIPVSNQDYALFDIQYTDEMPTLTVTKPDNTKYELVENENCMYQTIDESKSESGITEKHIYISVIDPMDGSWKIESNKSVECTAMNVLALPELKNVSCTESSNNKLKVNWEALNVDDSYTVDIHLSEIQKKADIKMFADSPEEYNSQMAAGYDPGITALKDIPVGNKQAEVEIPERLLSGEYQARVVLKKGEEVFASELSPETFSYVNPNVPSKPENIKVELGGDGQYKVTFDAVSNAQGYVVTVLDENGNEIEGFEGMITDKTTVYVGNQSTVPTGYDDNGNPTGYKNSGVNPGKSYKVKVYAFNEKDLITYASEEYISDAIYLPEPNPAKITLKLDDITAAEADGLNKNTVGATTNEQSSVIKYISDQDVDVSYWVDGVSDGQIYSVKANAPFEVPVTLDEGGSVIEFLAVNGQNDYTTSKLIATLDTVQPELLLDSISVLSVGGKYEIVGTTEPNARVYVGDNSEHVPVINGSFAYLGTQTSTRDEIKITSFDAAGNETTVYAEVLPSELSDFKAISIRNNSTAVENIELNQGDTAKIEVYGVSKNDLQFNLDNSNVSYNVVYGNDKVSVDEKGVISANYYGEAVVLCQYYVTDNYSLEESVSVVVKQEFESAKDIRISTTDISNNEVGVPVARLSIPDAPVGVTYQYDLVDNDYFEIIGNQLLLKKKLDVPSTEIQVTAQGRHVLDGAYENIGTPISKSFSLKVVKNIVSAEKLNSITVNKGRDFEQLDLPETVKVTLNTGEVKEFPVTWAQGAYNPDVVTTYNLKGTINRDEDITNPDDICAEISVTVRKRSSAHKITSQLTMSNVTVGYVVETFTVSVKNNENSVFLTDEILKNETDNLKLCFDDVNLTLDNDTVSKIKASAHRKVSVVRNGDVLSVNVCGLPDICAFVEAKATDIKDKNEFNAVVVKDGDIVTNSYIEGDYVIFNLKGNGDYKLETRSYSFADTDNSWAKDYISFVAVRNMISGTGNYRFAPEQYVTRAEFLKMILSAFGINPGEKTYTALDFSKDDWFAPYVGFAMENKIVKGYENGTFRPNNEISREEMIVMLNNCMKYLGVSLSADKIDFTDKILISDWAKDAISNVISAGLITGKDDGRLDPLNKANRAECAVVMMRCVKLMTNRNFK